MNISSVQGSVDSAAELARLWNQTCDSPSLWPSCMAVSTAFITVAFMLIVMLIIVCGNLLVVLTVNNDHKLRSQRQNWLIVSLAVADLLVGLLVMPLTMSYEVIGVWVLGDILCEIYLALDVLFVTASILHICVISLDRYWSVTQPLTYPSKRTTTRISIMIGVAWIVSLIICLPPIFGWRPNRDPGKCTVSDEIGYVIYSASGSFFIPVIVLVIVYWRIYTITKHHSRQRLKETQRTDQTLCQLAAATHAHVTANSNGMSSTAAMLSSHANGNKVSNKTVPSLVINNAYTKRSKWMSINLEKMEEACESKKGTEKRRRLLKIKERQATLLLGLILTAFIASWLPFFTMYVLGAFDYNAPELVFKFFFWLGYCNSGINPIIYTIFNREFKRALLRQLRKHQRFLSAFRETIF
ncbi:Octopamine receptor [Aphelenchoides bicaudatus]|nr:Octopamine receptor [Aphelenchoides bicaudatus]